MHKHSQRPVLSMLLSFPVSLLLTMPMATTALGQSAGPSKAATPNAVPRLIKYSGTLVDGRGYPLTVPVEVTFSLYGQQAIGSKPALWQEKQQVSPNEKGAYTIYLGAATANGLPAEVFTAASAQWLGIRVEDETELPRVLLTSVPYALKAGDAQTLGGLPASAFALAGSITPGTGNSASSQTAAAPDSTSAVTTTGGISGYFPKFTGAATIADSQVFSGSSGVGISTATPAAVLDVNGDMIVRGPTIVSRTGNATSAKGFPSFGFDFYSNAYNSSTQVADNPHFILQSEPVGNNTASTSATFNVLYSNLGKTAESGLYINADGTIHFAPGQPFPGSVTSVGLSAPAADFTVTGSPLTSSGTLGLNWTVQPTSSNVPNSIIKRDAVKGFSAGAISAESLATSGTVTANSLGVTNAFTVFGTSYMAAAYLSGPVGIGTNSPAALLNLNKNNQSNLDALLIGDNQHKGLQLRDTGTGVDIESIGVPLYMNYQTEAPIYLNPFAGPVFIHDSTVAVSGDGTTLPALTVGGNPNSSLDPILTNEPYSAHFKGDILIDGSTYTPDIKVAVEHPLDPANKYLVHAPIASSEALNQYSGNITTDELGLATVHLPDWFEAENADFRYQLTVISGQFAQAVISKKVAHNQFTISTNAPHVEVSWLLTAKRNDAFAKAHPMVVEPAKAASRRGHYDHPELYGQPQEKPPSPDLLTLSASE